MTDLAAWLLDRIAADEAAARALLRRAQDTQLQLADPKVLGLYVPGWHDWPDVEAMCVRVLAECDAKRRIVALSSRWIGGAQGYQEGLREGVQAAMRLLAVPYADQPGYREEWRP